MVSSSLATGWSPVSRSMIESRRAARPTRSSRNTPSLSGPRWTSVALIRSSRSRSILSREAIPQIPHTEPVSLLRAPTGSATGDAGRIVSAMVALTVREHLQLFALLAAGGALVALAPTFRIPYPILLVLGGLVLGFMPGLPNLQLPPDIVLVAILPPLLYYSAFSTSLRDLRANARPISLLSLGLVAATTVGVAAVAHAAIAGLPWSSAFVLGAVVSPTDPIAATSIAHRLGVPRRLIAIIEGESLVNDASALVLYRFAV